MPLLSVILESRGHSASMIGLNTAVAGLASIAAAPLATPLAARFGVVWTMLAMIVVGAFSVLGFYVAPSFWMWFPLRAILHVALTVLFILSEFWISMAAPPRRRGFVLGVYSTVLSLGFAFGPWLYAQMGSSGFLPFGVTFALVILAALPVLAAAGESPRIHQRRGRPVSSATSGWCRRRPPHNGLRRGRDRRLRAVPDLRQPHRLFQSDAALLLSMIGLGNVVMQIPIGYLSDRIGDRRIVLVACAAVGLLGMLALPWLATDWNISAALLLYGAAWSRHSTRSASPISAPGSPAANSPRPTPPSCSATDLACWSARRSIGIGMDLFGPDGFNYRWPCSSRSTSCSPSRASPPSRGEWVKPEQISWKGD